MENQIFHTRKEPTPVETFRRSFELDRAAINAEARTVTLSFSSEVPVERYFGSEILDHAPGSVRLDRLNNGAPLLLNHDTGEQIGVVESATIGKDRKGRAVVRFSKGEDGEEIFQDVLDGIRRLVSVGYRIHKTVTESKPGGVEIVRVTDWEPYEISLVSVPADDSVGVGRNASNPAPNQNISNTMNRDQIIAALLAASIAFDSNATDDQLRALLQQQAPQLNPGQPYTATRAADPPAPITVIREAPPITQADLDRGLAAERSRIATIGAIADQARANGITVDMQSAIGGGLSADAFRTQVYNALVARGSNYTPGTPSRTEARDMSRFSLVRAIGTLLSGRQLDGIEREMDEEARAEGQRIGVSYAGQLAIPHSWMVHSGKRDMTATIDSTHGQTLIPTFLGSFIDLLYNKLVFRDLGAVFLTGLTGNIDLPRLATGTVPALTATEVTASTESSPTTDKVSLTPNRLATYVEVTKRLMLQSDASIENMLRNDMARAMAVTMEVAAIHGTGTNEGLGICAQVGIGDVAGGTHGAAPTWANIVALETEVAADNADLGSLAYLTNTRVRGKLKTTAKVSSTDSVMIWDKQPTPLNEYKVAVTNSVSHTLTKGNQSLSSAIIFGNFADLVFAQWGGIDILVNPYSLDTTGMVRINVESYYDTNVRRVESFAAMLDALTA